LSSLLKPSFLFIIFLICNILILCSIFQTIDTNKPHIIPLENVSSLYMDKNGSFVYGTNIGDIVSNEKSYKVEGEITNIYAEMNNEFIIASTKDNIYCFFNELKWGYSLKNSQIIGIGKYFKQNLILANIVIASDEGLLVYARSGDTLWKFSKKGICDVNDAGDKIVFGGDNLYFFKNSNNYLGTYDNYENSNYKIFNINPISFDLNWNGRKLIVLTENELIYFEDYDGGITEKWRIPVSGKEVSFHNYEKCIAIKNEGIEIYNLLGELIHEDKGDYIITHGGYFYKISENVLYCFLNNKLVWKSENIFSVKSSVTNEQGNHILLLGDNKGYYFSQPIRFFPGSRKYWGIFLPFFILQLLILIKLKFDFTFEKKEIKLGIIMGITSTLICLKFMGFYNHYFIISGCIGFIGGSMAQKYESGVWGIIMISGFCIISGIFISQILAFYYWVFYFIPSYPSSESLQYAMSGIDMGVKYGFFSVLTSIFIRKYFLKGQL